MKKKFVTTFVTLMTFMAAMPMNTYAANHNQTVTVTSNETKNGEVKASITVTDAILEELGLNVIVSFPTEIALSLDDSQNVSGSDKIYAYGIMDSDNILSIKVDKDNEVFGKIKYYKDDSGSEMDYDTDEHLIVINSLDGTGFSAAQTRANYFSQKNGRNMTHYIELEVEIENFIPTFGTGTYYMNVPLKMEIQ